ncbi:cilia- and flagella-associated protein 251-like [Diorhabda sublineata]|uniref:cilia- and flagella-associated protein 251-like n=1 Tax=Diorhabda sublineata TaxID=1163346 RepID=UPI0024E16380|nr:cilia- and flagella-associated protein 251-like [Diorhabda sublineata]
MSDESITNKEDNENLLYLAKRFQLDEVSYEEDHVYIRESIGSETSLPSSVDNISESTRELLNSVDSKLGPKVFKDPRVMAKTKPFDLEWCFGLNSKVRIVNLTKKTQHIIMYACSHYPIIYNYCDKKMIHLEGHSNIVTSITCDVTGRWVATSASKNGFLHIWDMDQVLGSEKRTPVYTMYSIYGHYSLSLARISPTGKYLITVGAVGCDTYSVDLWLWTLGKDVPEDHYRVPYSNGTPVKICYNPDIEEHIMIIFTKQIVLLVWNAEENKFVSPCIPQIMHKNKIGHITGGTYANKCHECYASSSKGCILVFGNTLYAKPFAEGEINNDKLFIDSIKVSPVSLEYCTSTEGLVITGDARGEIYFFNKRIEILYWIRDFNLGPIASISFCLDAKLQIQDLNKYYVLPTKEGGGVFNCDFRDMVEELEVLFQQDLPTNATIKREPFIVRDFVVATAQCNIYAIDVVKNTCVPLFHLADGSVTAIDVHEESNYLVIAYDSNRVILMDYETNQVISQIILPNIEEEPNCISCIKYSKESFHLVCGKTNGEIWILEPILLKPKITEPFQITKNKILKIQFSYIPIQFAYYDDKRTVCLFSYNYVTSNWEFCGKIRAHYDDITDMMFLPGKPSKLCTIARDRHLVQYNNCTENGPCKEISIESSDRIEQTAVPMCFVHWLSTVGDKQIGYIVIADDQILANCESKYMVFGTQKHFGLQILPPDGNPYKYVGYLAHPAKLHDFRASHDGKYIFTCGSNDHSVLKWRVNVNAVEVMKHIGGKELEPFYCLLEGGYQGWLFHEIKDLFYYMQILQQENIDLPRRVTDSISVTEIPDLFRTIGFYPSDFELENIMIDVKYRNVDDSNTTNDDINFTDFVKLYCNYKPVYGYSSFDIEDAFNRICYDEDRDTISRDEFIDLLTAGGEPLTRTACFKCFKTLMRVDTTDENFDFLPEEINFHTFFEDILGIEMHRERVLEVESSEDDEVAMMTPSKVALNE